MASKRTIVQRFAWVAVATLAVGACSSSQKTATTAPSTAQGSTAPASATATGSPIKIGAICTCSGPLSTNNGDIPLVYKAWVASVNAAGGINGHRVQFILDDDAGNPATSSSDAQTLVSSDHVIALVDMTNDDETWAAFVESAKVPVVGAGTSTTPMYTNPDFYPEGQTEDALFPSIIDAAKSGGATNLGLLYCAEAVQCQEGIAPLKATGKALGLPVTYAAEVSATAPNYTAQCVAAQQAHITALFVADITFVAEKLAQNCSQQNYHPLYVVDGEILEPSFTSAPGIKDNLVAPMPNLPYFANSPAIQAMNTALDKYGPGVRTNSSWGELPSESWASGLLLADAAKAGGLGANGGAPTSAELVQGLAALKGDTLDGFSSPLTFTSAKAHPDDCWFTAALKNGVYTTPVGLTSKCESN